MKILIDMNLSPSWTDFLGEYGVEAIHWNQVGDPRAPDQTLFDWAKTNNFVLFTLDLDFGAMLAATHANGPSVIQVRTDNNLPSHIGPLLIELLKEHEDTIRAGRLGGSR